MLVTTAGLLWLAHIAWSRCCWSSPARAILSDAIQFALGAVADLRAVDASRRSEGMARSFWRLTAVAYAVWIVAQGLSVFNDLAAVATRAAARRICCFPSGSRRWRWRCFSTRSTKRDVSMR